MLSLQRQRGNLKVLICFLQDLLYLCCAHKLLLSLPGPAQAVKVSMLLLLCRISTDAARGRLSAELLCPYPPGVPLAFPGEALSEPALRQLQQVVHHGGRVSGASDQTLQTVLVLRAPERSSEKNTQHKGRGPYLYHVAQY